MAGTSAQPFDADIETPTATTSTGQVSNQPASADHNNPIAPGDTQPIAEKPPENATSPRIFGKSVQIHNSYLVVETADGVSLVDQHALHERILYEELRLKLADGGVESQRLLIPEMLELETADHALALEHAEILAKLGLEVQDFGEPTLAVLSIPLLARHLRAGELVRDLIDRFRHSQAKPEPEAILNLTLATIACKAAVKAGDRLEPAEIDALLAKGLEFSHSHHCPHGRPSALVFSKTELEKQFGRI
jgi:DNA mismatch repair protein MutL